MTARRSSSCRPRLAPPARQPRRYPRAAIRGRSRGSSSEPESSYRRGPPARQRHDRVLAALERDRYGGNIGVDLHRWLVRAGQRDPVAELPPVRGETLQVRRRRRVRAEVPDRLAVVVVHVARHEELAALPLQEEAAAALARVPPPAAFGLIVTFLLIQTVGHDVEALDRDAAARPGHRAVARIGE